MSAVSAAAGPAVAGRPVSAETATPLSRALVGLVALRGGSAALLGGLAAVLGGLAASLGGLVAVPGASASGFAGLRPLVLAGARSGSPADVVPGRRAR